MCERFCKNWVIVTKFWELYKADLCLWVQLVAFCYKMFVILRLLHDRVAKASYNHPRNLWGWFFLTTIANCLKIKQGKIHLTIIAHGVPWDCQVYFYHHNLRSFL